MGDTKRSNGRTMVRSRMGLWWGVWLVLALWVLPHPTWAAFNSTVASTISWFYAAAFSRTPVPNSTLPDYGDLGGLTFWTEAYLTGADGLAPFRGDVYAIADFFVTSTEFQAQYPASLTHEAFVAALYENMLGRAPDSVGLAFWVGQLSAGASRGTVLADFTNSEENRTSDPLRQAALASFIAFIAADADGTITPAEAAAWLAQNPTLDGARVDGALPNQTRLTVTRTGTGSGTVTSSPAGIDCGSACAADFAAGTAVTLTASPVSGSTFSGWSGACNGTGTCQVTMSQARSVTATFDQSPLITYALTLNRTGTGSGTVGGGGDYTAGATVNLTAIPAAGSTFAGWSPSPCASTFVMPASALTCTATFTLSAQPVRLTVTKTGTGSGTVTSSPAGIDCGSACAADFAAGTAVTLTATPVSGSTFSGWGGDCSGAVCQVTMSQSRGVTASFTQATITHQLTVARTGTGSGTVTSSPAGIDCGSACTADLDAETSVTLTATPVSGSTFSGWSEACSGTGTCQVMMSQDRNVTAIFTYLLLPLNDTGIDWCANADTNDLPCPVIIFRFPGQDGDHGRDALARAGQLQKVGGGHAGFDFTKVDAAGNALPASAERWDCVRDNHTGLIWEVKTTDGGLRDWNHTYSWYDPNSPDGNPGVPDGGNCTGSSCDTDIYVQAVNAQGLCGASDWRMPTWRELQGIVDYGRYDPAIDTGYFPNTPSWFFWSASPVAYPSSYAWVVFFNFGLANYDGRSSSNHVRLVRGGQ